MAQNLLINILAKDKTRTALASVQAGLGRLQSTVFSIQGALAGIGGALVIRSLVNVGSQVENLSVRFAFLFKGMEEGNKAFNTLIDFASKVPFSLEDISAASGNLAVVSKDAKDLAKILEITGNVATVTGIDFQTTATQIQRAFAGGIAAADIFREKGVRELLGFEAGAKATAKETREAFNRVFGPDGEFGQAMEVMAVTFTGTLSMLSDKLFKFKLETNRAGFFDFVKNSLVVVNRIVEENSKLLGEFSKAVGEGLVGFIKQAILGTAALMDMLAPIFRVINNGLAGLFEVIKALPPGVRELGIIGFLMFGKVGKIAIVGILGLLKYLKVDLDAITSSIFGSADETERLGSAFEKANKFIALVEENIIASREQMNKLLNLAGKVNKEAKEIGASFEKVKEILKERVKKELESINDKIAKGIIGGIRSLSKGLAEVVVRGKQLNMTLKEIAQSIMVNIIAQLIEEIALRQINKILGGDEVKVEAEKLNLMKSQNTERKRAILFNALGGGGGFSLPGFAKGGAVSKGKAIVVGERGPEMFVPNSTGQITQSSRGTSGNGTTVNFNINTVDASGFEELLVRSRGTITQLINSAVNERGKESLI
jgi:hypothetical protein